MHDTHVPSIQAGSVTVVLPPSVQLPSSAGTLSVEEVQRLPRARKGVGLVCEQVATALEKAPDVDVPGVTPDSLRRAGQAAETIDDVLADLGVVLERLRQANLLLDAEAHVLLRQVHAQVQARAKFDAGVAERFTGLSEYFGRGK